MDIEETEGSIETLGNIPIDSPKKASWIAWFVGGIPIILTFFQTTFTIANVPAASVPIVGLIATFLRSFELLNQVAIIFYDSSTTIAVLFLIITGAWVAQGYALSEGLDRKYIWGAAISSSVFFFVLFFGVYWPISPLVDSNLPTTQRLVFFVVPFVSSGAVLFSAKVNPDMAEEILKILNEAEDELRDYTRKYQSTIEKKIGEDLLAEFQSENFRSLRNPTTDAEPGESLSIDINSIEKPLEEHREKMESLHSEIEGAKDFDNPDEEDLDGAKRLRAEVRTLRSPADVVDRPAEQLRNKLSNSIEAVLQSELTQFKSLHGNEYKIENLGSGFDTVDLEHTNTSTTVTNSANHFKSLLESQTTDIRAVIKDSQKVIDRFAKIRQKIKREHAGLKEKVESVEKSLSTFDDWLGRIDSDVHDDIRGIFHSGRKGDSSITASAVENKIDMARDYQIACEFQKKDRILDEAQRDADKLINIIEFITTLTSSASGSTERRQFSVPTSDDPSQDIWTDKVVETLDNSFRKVYDVSIVLDGNMLEIAPEVTEGFRDDSTTESSEEDDDSESKCTETDVDAEPDRIGSGMIVDGVNTLINNFIQESKSVDRSDEVGEKSLSVNIDDLTQLASHDQVVEEFESLMERDDQIANVKIQTQGDQGIITVRGEEAVYDMKEVMSNAKRSYNNE